MMWSGPKGQGQDPEKGWGGDCREWSPEPPQPVLTSSCLKGHFGVDSYHHEKIPRIQGFTYQRFLTSIFTHSRNICRPPFTGPVD